MKQKDSKLLESIPLYGCTFDIPKQPEFQKIQKQTINLFANSKLHSTIKLETEQERNEWIEFLNFQKENILRDLNSVQS